MDKSIMEVVIEGAEDLHRAGLMSDSKLDDLKKRLFKNPEVKEEYDRLEEEFVAWKKGEQVKDGLAYQEELRGEWDNPLEYKGFKGSVEYSAEDDLLYGKVLSVEPLINYEGSTLDELKAAFEAAIDDYLAD